MLLLLMVMVGLLFLAMVMVGLSLGVIVESMQSFCCTITHTAWMLDLRLASTGKWEATLINTEESRAPSTACCICCSS